jgi:iron complex outermembrane receptor protein
MKGGQDARVAHAVSTSSQSDRSQPASLDRLSNARVSAGRPRSMIAAKGKRMDTDITLPTGVFSTRRPQVRGPRVAGLTRPLASALALATILAVAPAHAVSIDDLDQLSLEELGNIRITSVSKKPERLADAAASVFVITSDDIRRSGARSLPEVLRLAPNLQVAQSSGYGYAISARGMNGNNNSAPNKLLVLIDGRSVYTPLFAGVFWDAQDVVLEDVERIEVISGPGGTLWGVNAVNGVINIITRSAADTQGSLLVASAGSRQADGTLRHGGALGADGHYRVYGRYFDRKGTSNEAGDGIDDAGTRSQAGFRADWSHEGDQLRLSGNIYDAHEEQPAPGLLSTTISAPPLGDLALSGANLTSRWDRQLDQGASLSVQAYYDHTRRVAPPWFIESLDILDLQFQHALQPLGVHSLVWGVNLRYSHDRIDNSPYIAFLPADLRQKWNSVFAQDEMALGSRVRLTLGARLEHNDYTGSEFLPNARIAWTVADNHLLWAAASRTVRAPSRLDEDLYVPGAPPYLLDASFHTRSEVAKVYELGYRGQLTPRLSVSTTVFHTDYDDLHTQEIDPSFTFLTFGNGMQGRATGFEAWGVFQATERWRLTAGYTALHERLWLKPGSNDVAAPLAAGVDPSNTWQLRSSWNLAATNLDLALRHVAALRRDDVPAYTTLDARVAWQLRPQVELSLAATNLLDRHAEYGGLATRVEIGPAVNATLAWTF